MLRVMWTGQASFIVASQQTKLAVDLFLTHTEGAKAPWIMPSELGVLDAALVTHEHFDHFDQPLLETLHRTMPRLTLIVPKPLRQAAAQALGFAGKELCLAVPGQEIRIGDVDIYPIASAHGAHVESGYGIGNLPGRFLGYVMRAGGVTLYHSGDTVIYPGVIEELSQYRIGMALLPINGRDYVREAQDIVGNLTAEEAVELAAQIGARTLVSMHYDTFAGNLGWVDTAVRHARRVHPTLNVLVMGYGNPIELG